ncbi:MAG: DUF3084 domain-containing protein [Leptolyngbya sp.]|nr:DUF3084 domain-containing protein [Leptolyngbya sp.]
MVSGYVLILAMLMLGGIIATVGDRIGTRVGKARLSLFKLRPRQTATLVSIATGSVISASTLAILFTISSQLRTGLFELGRIQDDLANAEDQLAQALTEQDNVREDLRSASTERQRALARLREINQSLEEAVDQQERTQAQLQRTRDQLTTVSEQAKTLQQSTATLRTERDRLVQQQRAIRAQIAQRDATIAQQDAAIAERDQAIANIDQTIAALDQTIAERDQAIAERERRLADLQIQQNLLAQQVQDLESQFQGLFQGSIALGRNQELLSGVVTISNRAQARELVNQLLTEANRIAIQAIAPGTPIDQQAIAIGNQEVERLVDRLSVGGDFVIRVLSVANYVIGEPCVVRGEDPCIRVFVDAGPNALVFRQGTVLSTLALETATRPDQELVERMNVLLASTQFIATQNGVLEDNVIVADNRTDTLLRFLTAIQQSAQPLDLQTVALRDIYAAGPIRVDIVASRNGSPLFSTRDFVQPAPSLTP